MTGNIIYTVFEGHCGEQETYYRYHLHLVLGKWVTHISVSNNLWENRYHIADTTTVQVSMNRGAVCPRKKTRKKKSITFYKLCMHVHSHMHAHTELHPAVPIKQLYACVLCRPGRCRNEQRWTFIICFVLRVLACWVFAFMFCCCKVVHVCVCVCVCVLQTGGWGWTVHRHCVSTVDRNISLQSRSRATLQTQHGIGQQSISLNYFSTLYINSGLNTILCALPQRVSPFPHTEIIVLFTLLLRKLTWCFLFPETV